MPQHSHDALPSAAPAGDPLAALRHATQAQHAHLDASLPIARPDATVHDYAEHAAALGAWLTALAPELQALARHAPSFEPQTTDRLNALQADLHDAQAEATAMPCPATQQQVHQALQQAPAEPDAVRWGLAYVVEGSQLGGQVLYRQLAERLAPHPLRYLQGQGAATGTRWKGFLHLLRTHLASPQAIEAACLGACAAFAGLQAHLRTRGVTA